MYFVSIISIIICVINCVTCLFLKEWVESFVWLFAGYSWIIVFVSEREIRKLKKEAVELEKYGIWQNKKYERFRGYLNKGYTIAKTSGWISEPPTW